MMTAVVAPPGVGVIKRQVTMSSEMTGGVCVRFVCSRPMFVRRRSVVDTTLARRVQTSSASAEAAAASSPPRGLSTVRPPL